MFRLAHVIHSNIPRIHLHVISAETLDRLLAAVNPVHRKVPMGLLKEQGNLILRQGWIGTGCVSGSLP